MMGAREGRGGGDVQVYRKHGTRYTILLKGGSLSRDFKKSVEPFVDQYIATTV